MIDLHTHILPGIDDGSQSLEESVRLIETEKEQGVEVIVATPHFYAQKTSVNSFLEGRERAYDKVMAWAEKQARVPRIIKGAEVYFFPGMGRASQLPELTMEGTRVILLEMPFAQWTREVYREVKEMIEQQKLTVLLAHLERFYQFQKDKSIWDAVLDLPVFVQLNAGSFSDWHRRRLNKKILSLSLPTVLGSDCHNMSHRPPNLREGRSIIETKMGGERILDEMDQNAKLLLSGTY